MALTPNQRAYAMEQSDSWDNTVGRDVDRRTRAFRSAHPLWGRVAPWIGLLGFIVTIAGFLGVPIGLLMVAH